MADREILDRGARPRRGRGRDGGAHTRRPGAGRAPAHLRAAALLRGLPARPALHRGARHHRPHLRHLPGRLPDELDRGDGGRLRHRGRAPGPRPAPPALLRRVDREPRAARVHAPRAGLPRVRRARSRWRATTARSSSRRWRSRRRATRIMRVVGGREIHPINVRVGGFYRAPTRAELAPVVQELERAREFALQAVGFTASLPFPDFEEDYVFVALSDPESTRSKADAWSRAPAWTSRPRSTTSTSSKSTSSTPPRCTRACATARATSSGPLARYALNRDRLSPVAREAADAAGLEPVCRNPFRSIVVRAVEILYALDEALRLIEAYEPPDPPGVEVVPRAGTAHGWTEAPRGMLWHRYAIDDDGTILDAKIVPPTSQNQGRIEQSLHGFVQQHVGSTTTSCGCAASRRSAATTRASRARRTSCAWRSTARDGHRGGQPLARRRRRRPRGRPARARALAGRGRGPRARGRRDRARGGLVGRRARGRRRRRRIGCPAGHRAPLRRLHRAPAGAQPAVLDARLRRVRRRRAGARPGPPARAGSTSTRSRARASRRATA